jgi:hypothetical protein
MPEEPDIAVDVDLEDAEELTMLIRAHTIDNDLNIASSLFGTAVFVGVTIAMSGSNNIERNLESFIRDVREQVEQTAELSKLIEQGIN